MPSRHAIHAAPDATYALANFPRNTAMIQSEWKLVREFGLEYRDTNANQNAFGLTQPIVADYLPGGGYLIVDKYPARKAQRQWNYRTLLLSAVRSVIYDSGACATDDEFGCAMDERRFAILFRTARAIR